jgi:translocation and assembly module TamB
MPEKNAKPQRRLRWIALGILVLFVATAGLFVAYLRSDAFRERVRLEVITQLEDVTGGKVELKNLTWSLSKLMVTIDDLTIHGLETPNEVPYAHLDHARMSLKIVSLLKRDVALRELDIQHPVFHLIVYPDGTTNQPRPKITARNGDVAGSLFDWRMEQLRVGDGLLLLNDNHIPFGIDAG